MFPLARRLSLLIYCYRSDDSEGKRVKCVCAFWDERYCKNRSITDVDWSPKVRPRQREMFHLLMVLSTVSGT